MKMGSEQEKIKQAKILLYHLLLDKKCKMTESEISIAYSLAMDEDVQEVLETSGRQNDS